MVLVDWETIMNNTNFKHRIAKEKETIRVMIDIYCKRKHKSTELCEECLALCDYALDRLTLCKFGDEKPPCRKCPVHCYKKDMREKIKEVMRFSGPRLIFYRPVETVRHLFCSSNRKG
jgi:hypothetical protein